MKTKIDDLGVPSILGNHHMAISQNPGTRMVPQKSWWMLIPSMERRGFDPSRF